MKHLKTWSKSWSAEFHVNADIGLSYFLKTDGKKKESMDYSFSTLRFLACGGIRDLILSNAGERPITGTSQLLF